MGISGRGGDGDGTQGGTEARRRTGTGTGMVGDRDKGRDDMWIGTGTESRTESGDDQRQGVRDRKKGQRLQDSTGD